jgi:hypothetical protein
MPHLILLGDSVFDNGAYVPGEEPVADQVREALPADWQVTLLAIDGDVVAGVADQLKRLPHGATHLAISVGGNDALRQSGILRQPATSVTQVLSELVRIQDAFRRAYRAMLAAILATQLPTVVCTIYTAIPGLPREAVAALSFFNDVIMQEAARHGVGALDLRLVCNEARHFSALSPIEPSRAGGQQIAKALARAAMHRDLAAGNCTVFH